MIISVINFFFVGMLIFGWPMPIALAAPLLSNLTTAQRIELVTGETEEFLEGMHSYEESLSESQLSMITNARKTINGLLCSTLLEGKVEGETPSAVIQRQQLITDLLGSNVKKRRESLAFIVHQSEKLKSFRKFIFFVVMELRKAGFAISRYR